MIHQLQGTNNDRLQPSHASYKQGRVCFQAHLAPTGLFAPQRRCFAWLPLSEKPYKDCHLPFHMISLLRAEEFCDRRKSCHSHVFHITNNDCKYTSICSHNYTLLIVFYCKCSYYNELFNKRIFAYL